MSATVRLKVFFQQCVASNPSLQLVEMEGWAGLGGVRYIPENVENTGTDQYKKDLNKLNIEIVNKLRATDAAFSLGINSLQTMSSVKSVFVHLISVSGNKLFLSRYNLNCSRDMPIYLLQKCRNPIKDKMSSFQVKEEGIWCASDSEW